MKVAHSYQIDADVPEGWYWQESEGSELHGPYASEHDAEALANLTWKLKQADSYIARLEKDNNEIRAILSIAHKLSGFEVAPLAVDNILESIS